MYTGIGGAREDEVGGGVDGERSNGLKMGSGGSDDTAGTSL